MWLQDFLPNERDCKNFRILTYGYNTQLIGGDTVDDTFLDYGRDFIQQLENARASDEVTNPTTHHGDSKTLTHTQERRRHIIFIGHSLGGIMVLKVCGAVRVSHTGGLTQRTRPWLRQKTNAITKIFWNRRRLYYFSEHRTRALRPASLSTWSAICRVLKSPQVDSNYCNISPAIPNFCSTSGTNSQKFGVRCKYLAFMRRKKPQQSDKRYVAEFVRAKGAGN